MPHNILQKRIGSPALRAWRLRLRGDRGSTLVETALSIAILMTLVIGILEASLAVYSYHFISDAAREGVRYAIVRGGTWGQAPWNGGACAAYTDAGCTASSQNIQDYVKSLAFPGIDPANITVTPTSYNAVGGTACTDSTGAPCLNYNAQGNVVEVKVQYNFPFSVPFIPSSTLSMSSTARMVVAQ